MSTSFTASAPGSLMLFGEHAVLRGRLALVCAVDRRVKVRLTPRSDRQVEIVSSLGRLAMTLDLIGPAEPFRFVTTAIKRRKSSLPAGFDLAIHSDFSHTVGLGSSAAVTVATLAALNAWTGARQSPRELFDEGLRVVRDVQGLGSGADVAASVFGGGVRFRSHPVEITSLPGDHPLTVVYSGYKRPTVEVVRLVNKAEAADPALFQSVFDLMGACSEQAAAAIAKADWPAVGRQLNVAHGLLDAIGVSDATLSAIAFALRADPGILGAKISGSGLGDCVIGLGRAKRTDWPYEVLPVQMSPAGVQTQTEA